MEYCSAFCIHIELHCVVVHMEYCSAFCIHIELHCVVVHNEYCSAVVQITMGHYSVEVHTKHWSLLEYHCVSVHMVVHTDYC